MARYEHLPIFREAYDLSVHIEKIVRNFSRYHKYTLGTELRNNSRRILGKIVDANNSRERRGILLELRTANSCFFSERKSSLYKGKPLFAIFGIGEYSFKSYKIAISGFYKKPIFSLILPFNNKPVMLDDTCYFK